MNIWSNFWTFVWVLFVMFAFVSYLFALFAIIADLVRDRQLSGWAKAAWTFFLVFFPFLTALIYLGVRGEGMAERGEKKVAQSRSENEDYIRSVTAPSASDEIAKAKALLDSGTIRSDEYNAIKAKALQR